jgi:ubiquinone/menaquinone biosynthesis C-methylase UbiE
MKQQAQPAPGPLAVSEPWDLVAEGYASEAPITMLPFARHALDWVSPGAMSRVLDVAAGSGILTLEAALRVGRVDAIDFSPGMLTQLERRRAVAGLTNVFAKQGDGQALPFEDAQFDAAFSMFGLMFFPDRARGFRELRRVLKVGGAAVVSSWAPVAESPLMLLMFGALRAADPTRQPPQTNLLSLENPELFHQELEAAGFQDVEIKRFTHAVEIRSATEYWDVIVRAGAPLALLKQRLGPVEWERQSALALAYLEAELEQPRLLETTAFLGFGRKPNDA